MRNARRGSLACRSRKCGSTADSLADFLPIVAHADDPLADSSALAVWTLSREAARHVKVVLGGDGGDELFAGYLTYPATLWHDAVTARLPSPVRRLLARAGQRLPTSERKVSALYKLRRFLRAADLPPAVAHFTWNGTWLPDEASRLVSGAARRMILGDVPQFLKQPDDQFFRPRIGANGDATRQPPTSEPADMTHGRSKHGYAGNRQATSGHDVPRQINLLLVEILP